MSVCVLTLWNKSFEVQNYYYELFVYQSHKKGSKQTEKTKDIMYGYFLSLKCHSF